MHRILLLLSLVFTVAAQAQKAGSVKGSVIDSASSQGLSDATVSVMGATDSSLISFTLTSNTGFFEIKNLDTGAFVLLISYQGYPNIKKPFSITSDKPLKDFGTINADQEYRQLSEVVVTSQAPIQVKGDTVAYKAEAFKTKPNATVEELLKKLPGVQVERDGTVKAQGEQVQKIYVDGKEFFGNDPKLATRNLTADMIDQVEVFEEGSEQSRFSGVDDGTRTKTINLKLKKDKTSGMFGRAGAGYGTDDRYTANLSASYFKGATKLSVVGRSNNVNNQNFTQSDQTGINTGVGQANSAASQPGITRTNNIGINYSDVWGTKMEVTGSYFFNNANTDNISNSYRQTFFPDSTVTRSQRSLTENSSLNHRFNLRLTYNIDSFNSIIYTPNASVQHSESYRNSSTESFALKGTNEYRINDNFGTITNSGDGNNWNNNLLFRHRFARRGRTFSINLSNSYNNNDRSGNTISALGFYDAGIKTKDSSVNQLRLQETGSNSYGVTVSYTEPIGRDKILELNYNYNNNRSESNRSVFDYNSITSAYDIINQLQTNDFKNSNESNRLNAALRVTKKKYNYQMGLGVQNLLLQSNNLSKASVIQQNFTNLFPSASFNYRFARSKNFRFDYRGRTNQPNVNQLQPIRDVSNPLYQSEGNPTLGQEYTNNFSATYNSFNMMRFRNIFTRLTFSNTYNKIVNSVTQLGKGVQLSRPVNADGAYNLNGIVDFGVPISKLKGGNINTTTTMNLSRDISVADSVKNYTNNLVLGENVRVNYNWKEKIDVGISAGITYNRARYTLNANNNRRYYVYQSSADLSYIFSEKYVLSTEVDYTATTGLTAGFNQSFFLWNASFARQFLKNKRGELKLSVFDILKQNRSIVRNITDNYIEDVQNSVLQRYFMLTFTYNLNKAGSGPANGRGNRMMRRD